jgi:hypothetical protein
MNYKKLSNQFLKIVLFSVLFFNLILPTVITAQTVSDSVELKKYQDINRKFPYASLVEIEYNFYTPTKVTTNLNGKNFLEANLKKQQWISTSVNTPLFLSKQFMVLNSFRYKHESMQFQNIDTALYQSVVPNIAKAERSNLYSDALNFIYIGHVFGRRLTSNLSTSFDFSSDGFERVVGKLTVSVNLKQNKRTSISVGLIGNTDPTVTTPVVPSVAITHWITNKWLFDCYAPAYLYIRRVFDDNSRFSFGANTTNGGTTFIHPEIPSVSSFTFQRGRIEIGANYQKIIGGGLTLFSKIGYAVSLTNQVMETNQSNVLIKMKQQRNLSCSIGLSYNLDPVKFKRR